MSGFLDEAKRQSAHAHAFQAYVRHEEAVDGGECVEFTAGKQYAAELVHEIRNGSNPYLTTTAMVAIGAMANAALLHGFCVGLQSELAGD